MTAGTPSFDLTRVGGKCFANLVELFRAMTRLPGSEIAETANGGRHLAFPTNPMFKGVWNSELSGDVDAEISSTIAWFETRQAPFFFWWTDDRTKPGDLGSRLEARGLLSMEGAQKELTPGIVQTAAGAPVMAMDLAVADAGLLDRVPAGFEIKQVADSAMLGDFKRVFVETYAIPEWAGQGWVDATEAFGIGRAPWRMFVGYLDGEPVATNMLFCAAGIASVYAVATLPKAQRRGFGAAITLAPLLAARKAGFANAALFSSEDGYPVYRRLGFVDVGTRINRYLWRRPG